MDTKEQLLVTTCHLLLLPVMDCDGYVIAFSSLCPFQTSLFLNKRPLCWPSGQASASRAAGLGSVSGFRSGPFSGSSRCSDFKIGTPVATLPGAWRYRVSAGTVWPGASTL